MKIVDKKKITMLFALCFLAYFSTYLGRLNYSASLAEMIRTEGFGKSEAGLIGTLFFAAYGIGQLFSGFLGDRLPCKWMVFTGLLASGLLNGMMGLLQHPAGMAAVWCVNGFFQAFIWSPMIRIMYEMMKPEERMKNCLYLNSSVPVGTMTAYMLTALLIGWGGWRYAFYVPACYLVLIAFIWIFGMGRMEKYVKQYGEVESESISAQEETHKNKNVTWKLILIDSGLCFLLFVLCIQGALKDGVTTWIPTYLEEIHNLGSMAAILSTMLIPLCNFFGVSLASWLNKRLGQNELRTALLFFAGCGISLFVFFLFGKINVILALSMLAVSTTSMMAVNTMLTAVLPSRFGKFGRASSVSGILNSSVYAGGAVSTFGIGALSAAWGWDATIFLWVIGAAVSIVICLTIYRKWNDYTKKVLD